MNPSDKRKQKKARKKKYRNSCRKRVRACAFLAAEIGLIMVNKFMGTVPTDFDPWCPSNTYCLLPKNSVDSIIAEGNLFYMEETIKRLCTLKAFL